MRQEEIEKLLAYIVNEESRLECEVIELQNRLRFRRISVNDCFELALTLQRLDDFRDFALIVIRLLNLDR
jgi:hypothetical protein